MSTDAFIYDAIRTPVGRYGGVLSSIRTDDLAALPIAALIDRNKNVDWQQVDDLSFGCANQSGEDNRNAGRMAALLAGLPVTVPANTLNRLCGSGMDAIVSVARAIRPGEAELCVAGGVESMSRAPFVMPKATAAFTRDNMVYDTTIGWRFVNKMMKARYGIDSMPETAENVAEQFAISGEGQNAFTYESRMCNNLFILNLSNTNLLRLSHQSNRITIFSHPRSDMLHRRMHSYILPQPITC